MDVFLSWSGNRSRIAAREFRKWIRHVINAVQPWMSQDDLDAGTRWSPEIAARLAKSNFGVIFVTHANIDAPWLVFEAGAIAKTVDDSHVCPYLLDHQKASDMPEGPLTQFQAKRKTKEETLQLVETMNSAVAADSRLSEVEIQESFEMWWPKWKEVLNGLPVENSVTDVKRDPDDMVEEILQIVRKLDRERFKKVITSVAITGGAAGLETIVEPILPMLGEQISGSDEHGTGTGAANDELDESPD